MRASGREICGDLCSGGSLERIVGEADVVVTPSSQSQRGKSGREGERERQRSSTPKTGTPHGRFKTLGSPRQALRLAFAVLPVTVQV